MSDRRKAVTADCYHRPVRGSRRSGFTLIETVIALAVITASLLLTVTLLALEIRVNEQLAAQREALAATERAFELLRSGVVPLQAPLPAGLARPASERADDLELELSVDREKLAATDLVIATIEAHYRVQRRAASVEATTLFWRPKP